MLNFLNLLDRLIVAFVPFPKTIVICIVIEGVSTQKTFCFVVTFFVFNSPRNFTSFNKTIRFYSSLVAQSNYGGTKHPKGHFFIPRKAGMAVIARGLFFSLTPAITIPPSQKVPSMPVSWSTQANKKTQRDYKKNRAEKYAHYFRGNRILPITELVEAVQPKTLSLIVTDIKSRRLAGLKKDKFEELLKAAGIPDIYFCRRSFTTWDILLPSQKWSTKLAGNSNITTKHYRLQPEYMGRRRIKATVCNVPIQISRDVLAVFPSDNK